jgi:hypothetical protein
MSESESHYKNMKRQLRESQKRERRLRETGKWETVNCELAWLREGARRLAELQSSELDAALTTPAQHELLKRLLSSFDAYSHLGYSLLNAAAITAPDFRQRLVLTQMLLTQYEDKGQE